jgi:hypothetical protein
MGYCRLRLRCYCRGSLLFFEEGVFRLDLNGEAGAGGWRRSWNWDWDWDWTLGMNEI